MILSVDFDIIMAPSIQLYNDLVEPYNTCREQNWDFIEQERYLSKYLEYDKEIYNKINEILVEASKKVPVVYIGRDHSSILAAINTEAREGRLKLPATVYNIDHHHDIYYSEHQLDPIFKYHDPTCGCWVGYLERLKLLSKYAWINNDSSKLFYPLEPIGNNIVNKTYTGNIKTIEIPFEEIEMLYFCSSLPYIPKKYDELFLHTLKLILDEKGNDVIYYEGAYTRYANDFIREIIQGK